MNSADHTTTTLTWAEDRAPVRTDSSADPGAKTEARADVAWQNRPLTTLRDWHQCDKPSRHDAAKLFTGRAKLVANNRDQKFHFPLNQHTWHWQTIFHNFEK